MLGRIVRCSVITIIMAVVMTLPGFAMAAKTQELLNPEQVSQEPTVIEADNVSYDKKADQVHAMGNVQVVQDQRMLIADEMTYNQATGVVVAKGHVSLLEPDGSVLFAEEVELRDSLKRGVVQQFAARFHDKSLMAANSAERVSDTKINMDHVVYSPCPVCQGHPEKTPLWQVKAQKAVIDEEKERVTYRNAFMELKGVPVLYTPYFSHPTPDAKRKSGFLTPKYKNDSIFGTTAITPYYYNIAPNKDLVLTPSFTSNEGVIMAGDYRHLLNEGKYELQGSITNPRDYDTEGHPAVGHKMRGHIEGEGRFRAGEDWDWGFKGKRASDDTYLKRYQFGDEDVLTSRLYAETMEDNNYGVVQALSFQGLKETDDPGQTPLVLPQADYHWESKPGVHSSHWMVDANALMLMRDEGVSSRRLSARSGWEVPHVTRGGHVFKFSTALKTDAYSVDNVPIPDDPTNETRDGLVGRAVPEAELDWSYPLIQRQIGREVFLEPTANIIASPYGGNPDKIPNEDSQDVEFSDATLFNPNHFAGLDRVESGPRTNYGLRGGVVTPDMGRADFLFGQDYRVKRDDSFGPDSGLEEHFSDFVGRVGYQSQDIFDVSYRFRFDKDTFTPKRSAVNGSLDLSPVRLELDYLALDEQFASESVVGSSRELMVANAALDVTEHWTLSANGHRDLEDGEWISSKVNALYRGDCVDFILTWFEEFTQDRDIRPNTTFSFQLSLKNLGY